MEILVVGFGEMFAPGAGFCKGGGNVGNAIGGGRADQAEREEALLR